MCGCNAYDVGGKNSSGSETEETSSAWQSCDEYVLWYSESHLQYIEILAFHLLSMYIDYAHVTLATLNIRLNFCLWSTSTKIKQCEN